MISLKALIDLTVMAIEEDHPRGDGLELPLQAERAARDIAVKLNLGVVDFQRLETQKHSYQLSKKVATDWIAYGGLDMYEFIGAAAKQLMGVSRYEALIHERNEAMSSVPAGAE